jgi:hypothetical protein
VAESVPLGWPVSRIYSLVTPITAFRQDVGIIQIPAGAKLKLLTAQNDKVGLCTVSWDGQVVMALAVDIRENGLPSEQIGDMPQTT